jgi:hypothetical protein
MIHPVFESIQPEFNQYLAISSSNFITMKISGTNGLVANTVRPTRG